MTVQTAGQDNVGSQQLNLEQNAGRKGCSLLPGRVILPHRQAMWGVLPCLAAKPIIDIMAAVRELAEATECIAPLRQI